MVVTDEGVCGDDLPSEAGVCSAEGGGREGSQRQSESRGDEWVEEELGISRIKGGEDSILREVDGERVRRG